MTGSTIRLVQKHKKSLLICCCSQYTGNGEISACINTTHNITGVMQVFLSQFNQFYKLNQ